jgi:hypothetical protein
MEIDCGFLSASFGSPDSRSPWRMGFEVDGWEMDRDAAPERVDARSVLLDTLSLCQYLRRGSRLQQESGSACLRSVPWAYQHAPMLFLTTPLLEYRVSWCNSNFWLVRRALVSGTEYRTQTVTPKTLVSQEALHPIRVAGSEWLEPHAATC